MERLGHHEADSPSKGLSSPDSFNKISTLFFAVSSVFWQARAKRTPSSKSLSESSSGASFVSNCSTICSKRLSCSSKLGSLDLGVDAAIVQLYLNLFMGLDGSGAFKNRSVRQAAGDRITARQSSQRRE